MKKAINLMLLASAAFVLAMGAVYASLSTAFRSAPTYQSSELRIAMDNDGDHYEAAHQSAVTQPAVPAYQPAAKPHHSAIRRRKKRAHKAE